MGANTKSFLFKSPELAKFKMIILALIFTYKGLELARVGVLNLTATKGYR